MDTPQTVVAVPQFILEDQQDTSLRDGLRNVPGISLAAGEGGSQGDNLTIRGFTARNDIFLDGIRDFGSYYRDAFDYESIDVLEGPAGVEFGRGVDGRYRQPGDQAAGACRACGRHAATGDQPDATRDGGRERAHQESSGRGVRVNVAGEESNVAARNYTNVRRFGIAPSVAFGLNGPTRLFVNYLHEGENDLPDYGIPYFGAGVPKVPRQTYYGVFRKRLLPHQPRHHHRASGTRLRRTLHAAQCTALCELSARREYHGAADQHDSGVLHPGPGRGRTTGVGDVSDCGLFADGDHAVLPADDAAEPDYG